MVNDKEVLNDNPESLPDVDVPGLVVAMREDTGFTDRKETLGLEQIVIEVSATTPTRNRAWSN